MDVGVAGNCSSTSIADQVIADCIIGDPVDVSSTCADALDSETITAYSLADCNQYEEDDLYMACLGVLMGAAAIMEAPSNDDGPCAGELSAFSTLNMTELMQCTDGTIGATVPCVMVSVSLSEECMSCFRPPTDAANTLCQNVCFIDYSVSACGYCMGYGLMSAVASCSGLPPTTTTTSSGVSAVGYSIRLVLSLVVLLMATN